ncbi:uncharacterized protein PRCAT00005290001 [Priceomyces carsonii]|uniref:uncharacterized protein n=1 Tax=Priceomyces carsonii TaxID=28549 RepID=UPI002EDAD601|nr:unnamed protein product [Priceomyces carsonii]
MVTVTQLHRDDHDFVPGTIKVFNTSDDGSISSGSLKKNKNGVILVPQPTESPNDPLNWGVTRKMWHFFVVCFITGLTAATSNDAGAAQDSLNEIYGISYDSMNTGAGVLFLFIGWSCIFFAPASSLYGRRITYLICLLAGALGCVWFAVSKTTSDTIWSQAFVGMGEACAEAQVQQSLADIFFQHQLGSVLTVYILATSVGSFLGPLIAQFISDSQTFRWVGWWGAIITGATLVAVFFTCEETVFDRSAHSHIYESVEASPEPEFQNDKLKNTVSVSNFGSEKENTSSENFNDNEAQGSKEKPKPYWKRIAVITPSPYLEGFGFKQYVMRFVVYFKIFTLPAVWLSGLLWGLQDAYMSFFLTTEDDYFPEAPWNYSETGVAIMNVATLVGAAIGCCFAGFCSDWHVLWLSKRNNGILEPEFRLWLLFATLIISPAGLIMFGVGAARMWPPWVIYGGLGLIGFGWGSIGDTAMSYMMDAYPETIIQGMVGVSIINNSLGSIFTFVCSYWLESSGTQNTYIALAVIDFATIALIIPFLIWGKQLRRWTKNRYLGLVEMSQGMG